jgi:rare lipoprotein A
MSAEFDPAMTEYPMGRSRLEVASRLSLHAGVLILLALPGVASADRGTRPLETVPSTPITGWSQSGTASWYGIWHEGKIRADGKPYRRMDPVAAHRTLPLGTTVKVTVLDTGASAFVVIRDRGPYIGGRIIDLSEGTAIRLGIRERGVAMVRVEVVR